VYSCRWKQESLVLERDANLFVQKWKQRLQVELTKSTRSGLGDLTCANHTHMHRAHSFSRFCWCVLLRVVCLVWRLDFGLTLGAWPYQCVGCRCWLGVGCWVMKSPCIYLPVLYGKYKVGTVPYRTSSTNYQVLLLFKHEYLVGVTY
jgi:hypothetical protein